MSSGFFSGIFFILDLYHWLTYSGWSLLLWFSSLFYSFGGIIVVQVLQCWTIYVLKILIFNRIHLRMTIKVWWIAVVIDKEPVCWGENLVFKRYCVLCSTHSRFFNVVVISNRSNYYFLSRFFSVFLPLLPSLSSLTYVVKLEEDFPIKRIIEKR